MIKEESYQKKIVLLDPWLYEILNVVKKELKNDHLGRSPQLMLKHFPKRSLHKLANEEIFEAYKAEINEGNEEIGEWITARWVLKNAEIYQFFASELAKINPKFDQIESIPEALEASLMERSIKQFGAVRSYIFSILNAVLFSDARYAELRERALKEEENRTDNQEQPTVEETLTSLKERFAREIHKLNEKHEDRLSGFLKKYTQDVEGLKKQLAQMQRKMRELSESKG